MSNETRIIIDEIVRRFEHSGKVDKLMLFGSIARNTANSDSDLDLLVISDSPGGRRSIYSELRMQCADIDMPIDLLVYSSADMLKYSQVSSHILNEIANTGITLYERK